MWAASVQETVYKRRAVAITIPSTSRMQEGQVV